MDVDEEDIDMHGAGSEVDGLDREIEEEAISG